MINFPGIAVGFLQMHFNEDRDKCLIEKQVLKIIYKFSKEKYRLEKR